MTLTRFRDWGAIVALALALLGAAVGWGSLQRGFADLKAEVRNKASADIVESHQTEILRELARIEVRLEKIEELQRKPSH